MKKILAVSGGSDSMVMLHMFRRDRDAIVAHFNHGTRPSATADELFVAQAAERYHLPFYSQTANLGAGASEQKARTARYAFLTQLAKDQNGEIYTAHHLDDLAESIAINLLRGTGWRGLTPLTLHRHPFLESDPPLMKSDILRYAAEHSITFRQDPTNTEDTYLRSRLRETLHVGRFLQDHLSGGYPRIRPPGRCTLQKDGLVKISQQHTLQKDGFAKIPQQLFSLYKNQLRLRTEIESATAEILPKNPNGTYPKSLFTTPGEPVATELLHAALAQHSISLTRPQLADLLRAIATLTPGKRHNLPHDQLVTIGKTCIILPSVI